jgi:acyl carrier protein
MAFTDDELDTKIIKLICEAAVVDPGDVGPDTSLMDDLELESLEIVELVMAVEEAFQIEIPDEDADRMVIIEDVIDYVREHAQAA